MDFLPDFDELPRQATQAGRAARRSLRQFLRDLFPNLRDAAVRWSEDDAGSLAASVAYYLALSLFPLVLLLISGLGIFLRFTRIGQDAHQQLLGVIAQQGSPAFEQNFRQVIDQLETQSVISGPSGLIAAVLAAIGVFAQLDRGFDRVWRIPQVRSKSLHGTVYNVLHHRLSAFLMLISLGAMIAVLFAASMAVNHLTMLADSRLPASVDIMAMMEFAFTAIANTLLFAMLYKFLPKQRVPWIFALRGGFLTAVVWEIGRHVLGAFLIGMRYTAAYGVVGSFIAVLLWCYYGMSIIFFGAEYVQVLQRRHEREQSVADESSDKTDDKPLILSIQPAVAAGPENRSAAKAKQRPRPAARNRAA